MRNRGQSRPHRSHAVWGPAPQGSGLYNFLPLLPPVARRHAGFRGVPSIPVPVDTSSAFLDPLRWLSASVVAATVVVRTIVVKYIFCWYRSLTATSVAATIRDGREMRGANHPVQTGSAAERIRRMSSHTCVFPGADAATGRATDSRDARSRAGPDNGSRGSGERWIGRAHTRLKEPATRP